LSVIDQPLSILIVEDNAALAANIYDFLEACGHAPDAAPDGESALGLLSIHRYDAIVLDWMMPRMDGMTMLMRLRGELKSAIPVVLLTAKDQLENKIQGFTAGADDYMVKPVALAELEIRLRVVASRARASHEHARVLEVADLRFDLSAQIVSRAGYPLALSPIRRQLLEMLMRRSPHVVSREDLEHLIWKNHVPDADILRSHMHMLRKAVDGDSVSKLIQTVAGTGYCIRPAHV
jgi:DNA-binding response OmpR family regulator